MLPRLIMGVFRLSPSFWKLYFGDFYLLSHCKWLVNLI